MNFILQIQITFQAVVSTDGRTSFAALIYNEPNLVFSLNDTQILGFDSGGHVLYADMGEILSLNDQTLDATNIFRIDGISYGCMH